MKKTFKAFLFLCTVLQLFLILNSCNSNNNRHFINSFDKDNLVLWYQQPGTDWAIDALPLGNGSIGAMVFGTVNEERILLNEKTVWDGGPNVPGYADANRVDSYKHLPKVRKALLDGDYERAEALSKEHLMGTYSYDHNNFGSYRPLGDVYVKTDIEEYSNYKRSLSLNSAVSSVEFDADSTHYTRQYFCSYPDQVMVMLFTADKKGKQNLSLRLSSSQHESLVYRASENGLLLNSVVKNNRMKLSSRVHVENIGGSVATANNTITVSGADSVMFILSADTDYKQEYPNFLGEDPEKTTLNIINKAKEKSYRELQRNHLNDYKGLFDRVKLSINNDTNSIDKPTDERVAAYSRGKDFGLETLNFQYGRYLLIASSRPGNLPGNLQGVWNGLWSPPWKSDYHMNINFQMNYWPAEVTNLSETHLPLIDYVEMFTKTGVASAKNHWNARGWSVSHVSNIWNGAAPYSHKHMYWSYYPTTGAWLCQHVYDHYRFTQDTTYLKERAYPIMKSQAEFLEDYLYELPEGTLASTPSWSAEHDPISIGAAGDHAVSWDLFNNIIEASEILELDTEERKIWKQIRDKIVPPKIGKWGQLQEWYEDVDDPNEKHRHTNHLLGLAPGRQISPLTTPELAEAAKVAIKARGNGSGSGWNMGQLTYEYARLFDGETAYEKIGFQIENNTKPNLFSAKKWFQIDGNLGATAGMAEMLLQSHIDVVHLLPALPEAWEEGEVAGLMARGGFEVDIKWENGQLIKATIKSKKGGLCKLLYNSTTLEIETISGKAYNVVFENDKIILIK
ncbi:glycoside hydrolase family 95 protein [Seonamhaeicola sp. MEBiC1930]|uniref:glycoside hydrolase family 95 protein n=1 Tax=Seonamhaeicola sp. MEBiC01930 TaxID=2976768 RepID=UPI003245BE0A